MECVNCVDRVKDVFRACSGLNRLEILAVLEIAKMELALQVYKNKLAPAEIESRQAHSANTPRPKSAGRTGVKRKRTSAIG